MQSGDAKGAAQTASENSGTKAQPASLQLDDDANIASMASSLEAAQKGLRPELVEFIKQVVVPILVDRYLVQQKARRPESEKLNTNHGTPTQRDFFTVQQLATRWSCSRGTVYNVLRSTGTKVVDFAAKGRKGHKLVPVAAVEEIERRKLRRLS
jgi:hypothetical protein